MPDNYLSFTKEAIEALPLPPAGQRAMYHDTKVRGLVLRVTAAGSRVFYLYRRVDGKPTKERIGAFPDWSIPLARKRAEERNGDIAQGKARPAAKRAEMTLGELWTWYLDTQARPRKATWQQDEGRWRSHLSQFTDVPLSEVTRQRVRDLHAEVARRLREQATAREVIRHQAVAAEARERGAAVPRRLEVDPHTGEIAANKAIYLLRTMFNAARDHELFAGINPAEGIRAYRETSRDRRLGSEELDRFLVAVADEPDPDTRDWITMALWTAARKSNVLAMRWEQIDWKRREWRIPETKNGDPQTIPLEDVEMALLERRRAASTSEYVFPGRWGRGHLIDGRKPWMRVLAAAGVEDFHVHDLRRTHGSLLADSGASLYLIGKALGHKDPDSTKVYARMALDPIREAKRRALRGLGQTPKIDD